MLLSPDIVHCFDLSFAWDTNTEPDLAGYYIYYKYGDSGDSGAPYNGIGADEGDSPIKIPLASLNDPEHPEYTIHNLDDSGTFFFVATAYDIYGNESGFSDELFFQTSPSTLPIYTGPIVTGPIVAITAPASGSSFNIDNSITFRGSAVDTEDGNISNRLSWRSNRDGVIGSGATFSMSTLSQGKHNITASATDSGDLPGSATITDTVGLSSTTSIVIDNGDPETSFSGTWSVSDGADPWNPDDPSATSFWSRDGDTYTWTFTPTTSGYYDFYMWWTEYYSRSYKVPVTISYLGGTDTLYINQKRDGGQWNLLGTYPFEVGVNYDITIISVPGGTQNYSTCADAVRFVNTP